MAIPDLPRKQAHFNNFSFNQKKPHVNSQTHEHSINKVEITMKEIKTSNQSTSQNDLQIYFWKLLQRIAKVLGDSLLIHGPPYFYSITNQVSNINSSFLARALKKGDKDNQIMNKELNSLRNQVDWMCSENTNRAIMPQ